jgi:hypothetical protein
MEELGRLAVPTFGAPMRISSFVGSIALGAVAVVISSTAFGNYPASGNVTGLRFSKGPYVMSGDDVVFEITGKGNCTVKIMGVPGSPSPALTAGGPLPLKVHAPIYDVGTYQVAVDVMSDSTSPYWCTGQAKSELNVGPTITGVTVLDAPEKSAARPRRDIHYAGEHIQVKVTGTGPAGAGNCGYGVSLEEVSSRQVSNQNLYDAFGTWDLGPGPGPGKYRVRVTPYKPPGASAYGPCNGKAEVAELPLHPNVGWVTGMTLKGFGYHFNMADNMGMPQFCDSCDSVFSPAHDRAFLGIQPKTFGSTPGGTCAYNVIQSGNGAPGAIEASYQNGSGIPSLAFPTQQNPPFYNMYNNDVQTITVTITQARDLLWPACNILDNPITKTITFTKNTSLPPVVVE